MPDPGPPAAASSTAAPKGVMKHAVVNIAPEPREKGQSRAQFIASFNAPSVQTQLELNDIPEFANEPGPGHYFGPDSYCFSSMGTQKLGKCASAPEVNFPKTGWKEWERVMITKGHEKAFIGRVSTNFPGPPPKGFGLRIVEPTKLGEPGEPGGGAKIGTSLRPDLSASLGVDPHGSPGPAYNLRDAPNPEDRFSAQNRKNKSFGLGQRFHQDKPGGIGPGQYDRNDTCLGLGTGRSFGCNRKAYDRVIRPGWEKEGQCRVSLGIGPPMREDVMKGGVSIGKAERFGKDAVSRAPGPGQYDHEERGMASTLNLKNGSVCSDTRRPGSLGFGKKPTKPRFRQLLAMNCCRHGGWGYF